jgi:hypothetical protein
VSFNVLSLSFSFSFSLSASAFCSLVNSNSFFLAKAAFPIKLVSNCPPVKGNLP